MVGLNTAELLIFLQPEVAASFPMRKALHDGSSSSSAFHRSTPATRKVSVYNSRRAATPMANTVVSMLDHKTKMSNKYTT